MTVVINPAVYSVLVEGISITVATSLGDILEVRTPFDAIIIPLRAWVSTEDEETSQQVGIEFVDFATAGSGGTSVTPEPEHRHLIASQCTCLRNNTTDASGTRNAHHREGNNMLGAGWHWEKGEGSIIIPVITSLVLGFVSALSIVSIISAGIVYAELGQ